MRTSLKTVKYYNTSQVYKDHHRTEAREAAAEKAEAEEVANRNVEHEASIENVVKEAEAVAENVAPENTAKKNNLVNDEFCPDLVYCEKNILRKVCSVNIYPEDESDIETKFKESVSNYFEKEDNIEKVLNCEPDFYGRYVNLKVLMKAGIPRGWLGYLNDPRGMYPELQGIRSVRHACKDVANCDDEPG